MVGNDAMVVAIPELGIVTYRAKSAWGWAGPRIYYPKLIPF
jgi:hypothetical protein